MARARGSEGGEGGGGGSDVRSTRAAATPGARIVPGGITICRLSIPIAGYCEREIHASSLLHSCTVQTTEALQLY